jgi:hypothetical protein
MSGQFRKEEDSRKKAEVEAATTLEELEGIAWTP